MTKQELITELVNDAIADTYRLIDCLYVTCNSIERNRLLNQMRRNMSRLCWLLQQSQQDAPQVVPIAVPMSALPTPALFAAPTPAPFAAPMPAVPVAAASVSADSPLQAARIFTPEELARNDGTNGYPAYVAVNNTVYDVTNNAAWAAASHFGLSAGRDVTREFFSCHAGQTVLSKLKVVGKMTA